MVGGCQLGVGGRGALRWGLRFDDVFQVTNGHVARICSDDNMVAQPLQLLRIYN